MKLWTQKHSWHKKNAHIKADQINRAKVKKIAVIRHAALGDMLLTRPMLITLKEAFPNAELTLSVVSNYMSGIPNDIIDNVHIMKGNEKKYGLKETLTSAKELGYQDIIFNVTSTNRSYWITKLNRAALKIGYMHKGIHRFLYDVAIPRANYRFESEALLEQVNILGIKNDWPLKFNYPRPERTYAKPYVLYFATASDPARCWPNKNMAEFINRACQKYPDRDHILLAGLADWEKETANTISQNVGSHNNFKYLSAGKDDFSLVAHADALVINDTGLRNLGITYGTPTICFFPASHNAFRYQPHFGNHHIVMANDSGPASVDKAEHALATILKS